MAQILVEVEVSLPDDDCAASMFARSSSDSESASTSTFSRHYASSDLNAVARSVRADLNAMFGGSAEELNIRFSGYQVVPAASLGCGVASVALSTAGDPVSAAPLANKRLDDHADATTMLAIAARQSRDCCAGAAVVPLTAHVSAGAAPFQQQHPVAVNLTVFFHESSPISLQILVTEKTTVGDVRQHLRDALGIPFAQQKWLSLQRKSPQRRSLDSAAPHASGTAYDTMYHMLLDDTRALGWYGEPGAEGSEIVAAVGPAVPSSAPSSPSEQAQQGASAEELYADASLESSVLVMLPSGQAVGVQRLAGDSYESLQNRMYRALHDTAAHRSCPSLADLQLSSRLAKLQPRGACAVDPDAWFKDL